MPVPILLHVHTTSEILLATREPGVVEAVAALGLALGVQVEHVYERDALRAGWSTARLRLVGTDMVPRAAELGVRDHTWVVGTVPDRLVTASAELNAPAVAVPDVSGRLAEIMGSATMEPVDSRAVAMVGASGGLGTSCLAVAMSMLAARRAPAALVELADCGGGLDLLLGAEAHDGLRWTGLTGARGQLGELTGLVSADGVDLVALDREQARVPDPEAIHAVMRSLRRSHRTVVVDAGRGEGLQSCVPDVVLLLVAADVRGVAAARMAVRDRPALSAAQVVARHGPGRNLPADAVAGALGMPLAGRLRHDPMVPRLAADGSTVAAPVARRLSRDAQRLWEVIAA